MIAKRMLTVIAGVLVLGFFSGCESGGGSSGSGNLGGTWTGTTAGRALSMAIQQDGTALSGSYTLSDPTFSENLSGTASSETAPATATLTGGGDRSFQLSFDSANSMSGGFYKSGVLVGPVSATK